ncbi:hypothetical protein [Nibribacter koreensis]|uniref:Uncharacterized protein n=1 Tax=Nibribacter koreensis TaxID=1084519 RepID=A0ABP8FB45_9BACT
MRLFYLCLLLGALTACKTARPVDPLQGTDAALTAPKASWADIFTAKKLKGNTIIFAGGDVSNAGPTKLKGSTLATNTQKAGDGSTLGAVSQAGADESKTKQSAVSEATAANTGGQGAQVSGNAESSATNTTRKGMPWYVLVGIGIAVGWIGPGLVKRIIKPV